MFATVHLAASSAHWTARAVAMLALTDTVPSLIAGALVVGAFIVLYGVIKAYTDNMARRISSHRVVLNSRPEDSDPDGLGVVLLIVGVLILAAFLMDSLH